MRWALNRHQFAQIDSTLAAFVHTKTGVIALDVAHDRLKDKVKPFEEIPGPRSLPLIGTLWKYLPLVGEYSFDRLDSNGHRKLRQFGPLVREDIVPGVPVVWVFTPEDIETVYRCEGRYPERRSHLAIEKYRSDRPQLYKSAGLLPTNGPEWWRLRSAFQKSLSRIQDVRLFLPLTEQVLQEFIESRVQPSAILDYMPQLSRLFLELTCGVVFGERLGSLQDSENTVSSRSSQLIQAAFTANSCILATDNGPQLWRKFNTPLYKKLLNALDVLETTALSLIAQNEVEISCPLRKTSLLGQYKNSPELDMKDILCMSVDMILAGIDTTTYTTCFALYHLATNPMAQAQLYTEAATLLPDVTDAVTSDTLNRAIYTKAVLKETFRLNPISIGVGRILAKTAVLSGFQVPAGTVVVTQNQVICRLPEYFCNPDQFVPERWVKGCPEYRPTNPYLVLPFGHGPRTCIARRLAEQSLLATLIKLVRKYEISWHGGHLVVKSLLINMPDQPVLLSLRERT